MYSKLTGIWVTIKDGSGNAIAMSLAAGISILTQTTTQCPDLTVTIGTFSITALTIKAFLRFIANYEKHKNEY